MKFHVGDIALVRNDLHLGEWYGSNCFVRNMDCCLGKYIPISKVNEFADCTEYRLKDAPLNWTPEMFQYVIPFSDNLLSEIFMPEGDGDE